MNPFTDLSDVDLIGLSTEWLMRKPENEAELTAWRNDLEALKQERERRRGE